MTRPAHTISRVRRNPHSAFVKDPSEMRMGSPQYGELILDGEPMPSARSVEAQSLEWSDEGHLLAAQELVAWDAEPETRVIVIDAERRVQIAASPAQKGLCDPIRFESSDLVYRHWRYGQREQELRLQLVN